MPYFRPEEDNVFQIRRDERTLEDKLIQARWYSFCGWDQEAYELLDEVAKAVGDLTYEETRFD